MLFVYFKLALGSVKLTLESYFFLELALEPDFFCHKTVFSDQEILNGWKIYKIGGGKKAGMPWTKKYLGQCWCLINDAMCNEHENPTLCFFFSW